MLPAVICRVQQYGNNSANKARYLEILGQQTKQTFLNISLGRRRIYQDTLDTNHYFYGEESPLLYVFLYLNPFLYFILPL